MRGWMQGGRERWRWRERRKGPIVRQLELSRLRPRHHTHRPRYPLALSVKHLQLTSNQSDLPPPRALISLQVGCQDPNAPTSGPPSVSPRPWDIDRPPLPDSSRADYNLDRPAPLTFLFLPRRARYLVFVLASEVRLGRSLYRSNPSLLNAVQCRRRVASQRSRHTGSPPTTTTLLHRRLSTLCSRCLSVMCLRMEAWWFRTHSSS